MNWTSSKYRLTFSALLAGLWAIIAMPVQADTLSDNLSSPTYYTEIISGDTWIAAGFGTDSSNYLLKAATLLLSGPRTGAAELDLYTSSGSQPGARVGVLASPTSYSSALSETTFAGQDLLLSAGTSYWLVLKALRGELEWAYTNSNAGTGVGFQHSWGESTNAGASWFTSDIQPMQFRVTADPVAAAVPEPASMGMVAGGLLLLAARAAGKQRRKSSFTCSKHG